MSQQPDHDSADLDDAVAYRIHRANRLLVTHLGRFLRQHDAALTPEKWFILARLRAAGPTRQSEMTDPVLGDAPNVSRLVDGLVTAGLVSRTPDPADRRGKIIELTDAGQLLAAGLLEDAVIERRRIFAGLSPDELSTFTALLDRIEANVRGLLDD